MYSLWSVRILYTLFPLTHCKSAADFLFLKISLQTVLTWKPCLQEALFLSFSVLFVLLYFSPVFSFSLQNCTLLRNTILHRNFINGTRTCCTVPILCYSGKAFEFPTGCRTALRKEKIWNEMLLLLFILPHISAIFQYVFLNYFDIFHAVRVHFVFIYTGPIIDMLGNKKKRRQGFL